VADPKCAVHEERLQTIENRLSRMEDDLDSIVAENHHRATEVALSAQALGIFKDVVVRLDSRIEALEKRIEAMMKDRWQIIAGLLANGAIGATSIAILLRVFDHAK